MRVILSLPVVIIHYVSTRHVFDNDDDQDEDNQQTTLATGSPREERSRRSCVGYEVALTGCFPDFHNYTPSTNRYSNGEKLIASTRLAANLQPCYTKRFIRCYLYSYSDFVKCTYNFFSLPLVSYPSFAYVSPGIRKEKRWSLFVSARDGLPS